LDARPRVPHLSSKTVVGPSIKKFLEKMGTLLDQQMTYKEGFIIVESEAGTGKNFKMDILANLTNRELFHISCNQSMEKEDLLFSPELNNE
jgi:tRNA U34 5-methylaminomethyl-2-thiouridine-forming methyltransferase MnmC